MGLRAKGATKDEKALWTIETTVFEALERYYRTTPIEKKLLKAYLQIRDN